MHSGAQPLAYSIIAIGASAGGLQAIGDILAKLPPTLACPVLVVIHLAPQFTSHAAAVLARNTSLHVTQARQDEVLRPGVVYIAPPDFHLNVENGAVRLTRSAVIHFSRPSVDSMLESVASNYGKRAIAVILTGSGSDGAEGLRAIKAAGGFTIVQDPNGAQFPAMPGAAVATHCADRVLPLGEIGALLNELGAKPGTMHAQ
ncbi:MAG: chemotaxis protein CheB [Acidobacteria bacterium]|nr:chemotaxis protein CheB [Acidobacteriota bacterium]